MTLKKAVIQAINDGKSFVAWTTASQQADRYSLGNKINELTWYENNGKYELNADGNGKTDIHTGLAFFDHMLDQIARHGKMDLNFRIFISIFLSS